ncbi:MAG: hypothetical protein ACO1SV_07520 [Fimbriimonas sp.]
MMTLAAIVIFQATNAIPPNVGMVAKGGSYVVMEGGKRRPANFKERRLMRTPEEPPRHPGGWYRALPTVIESDFGTVRGHKVVDENGRGVASLQWLLGDFEAMGNPRVDVIGWGPGGHEVVVAKSGGSPSAGGSTEYASLDLRTRLLVRRVVLGAGSGLGLVVGDVALPKAYDSREGGTYPPLYRIAAGRPIRLKLRSRSLSAVPVAVAPAGRWAILWRGENLLADLATGDVRPLGGQEARFLP